MAKKTIKLKIATNIQNEATASATVTPGEFVEYEAAGTVKPNSVAGGLILKAIAVEDEMFGGLITDTYTTTGNPVQYQFVRTGDEVLARLDANENIAIGAFLTSSTAGQLKAAGSDTPIAMALKASNVASIVNLAVRIL